MDQGELERFVDEFTASLNGRLKEHIKYFPQTFNGLHVKSLAQDLVRNSHPSIKMAGRDIEQLEINTGHNFY